MAFFFREPPKLTDFRLAIFDLDGTLSRFDHDKLVSIALEVFGNRGFQDLTPSYLLELHSQNNFLGFADPKERPQLERELQDAIHYSEPEMTPVFFEGVGETLEHLLAKGLRIAIATARRCLPEELVDPLKQHGLLQHISHIATRGKSDWHWTNKKHMLEEIFQALTCQPAESFVCGDTPSDIESARAVDAGLSVALLSGGIDEKVLKKSLPDCILESVSHIPHAFL